MGDLRDYGARCAAAIEVAYSEQAGLSYLFIFAKSIWAFAAHHKPQLLCFATATVPIRRKRVAPWHIGVQGALLLDYFLLGFWGHPRTSQSTARATTVRTGLFVAVAASRRNVVRCAADN
jgi:hypothetical protein